MAEITAQRGDQYNKRLQELIRNGYCEASFGYTDDDGIDHETNYVLSPEGNAIMRSEFPEFIGYKNKERNNEPRTNINT